MSSSLTVHDQLNPSPWVERWAHLVAAGGVVLDVASGAGRHARYFSGRGHAVIAVDRDAAALESLRGVVGVQTKVADLEEAAWPFVAEQFDAIVVTNYLHRPLLPHIIASLGADGVLIYETFMAGNERYGRPSNPAFLLQPDELLTEVAGHLSVVAFEQGIVQRPRPAAVQRLCATRQPAPVMLESA